MPKATKRKATKRKATKRKFSGVLDRPMIGKYLPPAHVPVLGGPITDEERRAAERAIADQFVERLAAWSKHYEVDPKAPDADLRLLLRDRWYLVPGF